MAVRPNYDFFEDRAFKEASERIKRRESEEARRYYSVVGKYGEYEEERDNRIRNRFKARVSKEVINRFIGRSVFLVSIIVSIILFYLTAYDPPRNEWCMYVGMALIVAGGLVKMWIANDKIADAVDIVLIATYLAVKNTFDRNK